MPRIDTKGTMKKMNAHTIEASNKHPIRIGRKLALVGSFFIGVLLLSYLPFLSPLNESLTEFIHLIWWAVLLGLFLGGFIEYFIPQAFIFNYLGQRKLRSLFYAVIAGFVMSACSHGILAIAIQLYKKGASIPSVITFLLATPWANVPITILLFSFFGLHALLFVGAAIMIALVTGFIFILLEKKGLIESSLSDENFGSTQYEWTHIKHFNAKEGIRGVLAGSVRLANMVLWWILIGVLAGALIGAYVPEHFFHQYLGPTFSGLLLTLIFATIIEVCSEGSSPIAFELFNKLGVLGNPFVFLMAGVITDYTEIGLLWSNIGKKTALWLPLVTVPQVLFFGWLFNMVII